MQNNKERKQVHLCRRFGEGSRSSTSGTDRILRQLEGPSSETWTGCPAVTEVLDQIIGMLLQAALELKGSLRHPGTQDIPAGTFSCACQHVRRL